MIWWAFKPVNTDNNNYSYVLKVILLQGVEGLVSEQPLN